MLDYLRQMFTLLFEGQRQGVLFFMVLYVSVVCLFSLGRLVRIRRWPGVQGELLARGARPIGADLLPSQRDHIPWARYRYEVDGVGYEGRCVSPWQFSGSGLAAGAPLLQTRLIPVQAGGRVTVYHDPRRPQRAYVLRPGWPGMAFLLVLATVPVALYALHYHG